MPAMGRWSGTHIFSKDRWLGYWACDARHATHNAQYANPVDVTPRHQHTHRCWQGCGTHAFPLERLFVNTRRNHERRYARKARRLSGNQKLNVPRDGVFRDTRLEPRLVKFQADLVDGHACFIIVHTGQHDIDAAGAVDIADAGFEAVKAFDGGYVHVVALNHHVRVDFAWWWMVLRDV